MQSRVLLTATTLTYIAIVLRKSVQNCSQGAPVVNSDYRSGFTSFFEAAKAAWGSHGQF